MEIEMSQMDWVSAPIPDNLGAPRHAPTLVLVSCMEERTGQRQEE